VEVVLQFELMTSHGDDGDVQERSGVVGTNLLHEAVDLAELVKVELRDAGGDRRFGFDLSEGEDECLLTGGTGLGDDGDEILESAGWRTIDSAEYRVAELAFPSGNAAGGRTFLDVPKEQEASDGVLFELETEGGQEVLQGEGDWDGRLVGVFVHSESKNRFDALLFWGQLHVGGGCSGSEAMSGKRGVQDGAAILGGMGGGRSRGTTSIGGAGGLAPPAGSVGQAAWMTCWMAPGGRLAEPKWNSSVVTWRAVFSLEVVGSLDDVFGSRSVLQEEAVVGMRVELRGAVTGFFDSDIGTESTEMADVGATTGPGGIWNVFEA
jgi:hypothetical protein